MTTIMETQMDVTELEACPFCGEQPITDYYSNVGWFVMCNNNDCATNPLTDGGAPTRAAAIAVWNRRAAVPAKAAGQWQDDPVTKFLREVEAELRRARAKFPGDRIMTIALAEEFGELAKAMLDEPQAAVWKEAVQTAVMAARVAIDGDSSVDDWRTAKGLDNHRAPSPPNGGQTK